MKSCSQVTTASHMASVCIYIYVNNTMLIIILPMRHSFFLLGRLRTHSTSFSASFSFYFASSITIIFITPRCQVCYYYPNLQYATYYQLQLYFSTTKIHTKVYEMYKNAMVRSVVHGARVYTKMNVIVK